MRLLFFFPHALPVLLFPAPVPHHFLCGLDPSHDPVFKTAYAEHAGATYRYYVTVDGVAQDPVDTESNCVSVNHLINGDGTYAFSVAAVKEGVASRYYTRVFRITDGMVTAI